MKQISNYISEKLHIDKRLKVSSFTIGAKVHWGSGPAGYKLVDYISTNATKSDILKFVNKYCTGNKYNWQTELKKKKFDDESIEFLNKYEYIIAFKDIEDNENDNSTVFVFFYNKESFKIEEKLHLDKEKVDGHTKLK